MTTAPQPRYSEVQERSRLAALCALGTHANPAMAALAVIDVAQSFLAEVVSQLDLQPQMDALACKAGCYTCCHQIVGISSAELSLLQQAIAQLPAKQQKQIKAQITKIARKGRQFDQAQWWQAQLRCPLLDEQGRCSIHAARPLPCRAMNSADASICERSYRGEALPIPILAAQHRVYGHAQTGLIQALAQMGQSNGALNMALALADQL